MSFTLELIEGLENALNSSLLMDFYGTFIDDWRLLTSLVKQSDILGKVAKYCEIFSTS